MFDFIQIYLFKGGIQKHNKSIQRMEDLIINLLYWHIMPYVAIYHMIE